MTAPREVTLSMLRNLRVPAVKDVRDEMFVINDPPRWHGLIPPLVCFGLVVAVMITTVILEAHD